MRCPSCEAENEAGRKFCGECGTRLLIACPSCGTANAPTTKFCGECGTPLAEATGGDAVGAASTRASAEGAEPQAERRLVSVLFADLVGFTAQSAERDAEDVREFLTEYFDQARTVVERYGGTVEKFIGDAVMAVWGTPTSHEDDAERAVRAALELLDAVAALKGGARARAAVMTGRAAVTLGATDQGMVAGDLVNTASRLQGAAPEGGVLVDETTKAAANRAISFEPVGPQHLRGKDAPVEAWRAVRVVAGRGGAGRAERLETPFVGRDPELRHLKELLHATGEEGRARLVSITGIAGIGKSRLVWELEKYIDGVTEDVYWHQGRSPAYGDGLTFWALGEMVRGRATIAETDDDPTSRAKLASTVSEYISDETERRWIEPRLGALLALEETPGDPEELYAAWRRFFERIAQRGTTALVFEDLQWADAGLLDFIESILEWSRSHPILVVTLARPELFDRRPGWGSEIRNFTGMHLDPLPEEAMRGLLAGLVPDLEAGVVSEVLRRAEGVPLYAVETIRMLVDAGKVEAGPEGYRATGPITALETPPTLHALIAARLDALDPRDRTLLQTASVLGQSFTAAALASITDEAELEDRLRGVVRRELLTHDADPRSPERGQYRFVQSMIREVAYDTLAKPERRSRHLAAARYFESLGDEELAGVLANHYLAAFRATPKGPEADALAAQTRVALRGAAERALALHVPAQAFGYFEQALEVTDDPAERLLLYEKAAGAAWPGAGDFAAAERYADLLIEGSRARGDLLGVARGATLKASNLITTGTAPAAVRLLEEALPELEGVGGEPDVTRLIAELGRGYMMTDRSQQALEMTERALAAAGPRELTTAIAEAMTTRGVVLKVMGRGIEGMALIRGAIELARIHGPGRTALRALWNTWDWEAEDDPAEAVRVARAGAELAERLGETDFGQGWLELLVASSLLSGDIDGAERTQREREASRAQIPVGHLGGLIGLGLMIDAFRGRPLAEARITEGDAVLQETDTAPQERAQFREAVGWGRLIAGDYKDAHTAGSALLAISPFWKKDAHYLMARAALFLGDRPRARAAYDGLTAEVLRGRLWRAQTLAVGAGVAVLEGRRAEAVVAFGESLRRFREITCPPEHALAAILFVRLVGTDDPEAAAAADEARRLCEAIGAPGLLARLDESLAHPAQADRAKEAALSSAAAGAAVKP